MLTIGTISSGTLKLGALFAALFHAINDNASTEDRESEDWSTFTDIADEVPIGDLMDEDSGFWKTELASDLFSELEDFAGNYLPPYTYIGSLEGDGAEYGVWPDTDVVESDIEDGTLIKVSDLSEVDLRALGSEVHGVVLVNDHGNMTVYCIEWTPVLNEAWAVV